MEVGTLRTVNPKTRLLRQMAILMLQKYFFSDTNSRGILGDTIPILRTKNSQATHKNELKIQINVIIKHLYIFRTIFIYVRVN